MADDYADLEALLSGKPVTKSPPAPKEAPPPKPRAAASPKAAVAPKAAPVAAVADPEEMAVAGAWSHPYRPEDVYDTSMRAFNAATKPAAAKAIDKAASTVDETRHAVAEWLAGERSRWAEANARAAEGLAATAARADELNRGPDVRSPMERAVPGAPIPTRTPIVTPPSKGFTPTSVVEVGETPADKRARLARVMDLDIDLTDAQVDQLLARKDVQAALAAEK